MGGFRLHCDECGHDQWLYHACRNRHCPRCQKHASQEWEQTQLSHLVNTHYFHLVFTLPHEFNGWARLHRRVIYNRLFQSVWDTLNTLGELHRVTQPHEINHTLNKVMKKEWVVYAKHAIDHPETVVRYLARYTRKIALSESRLLAMDKETVTFKYKDYRDHQNKQYTLKGVEFIRRYLQHVFPLGFMRIRHYGWLSNSSRKKQLAHVRKAIDDHAIQHQHVLKPLKYPCFKVKKRFEGMHCPCCKKAIMNIIQTLLPPKMIGQGFT